MSDKTTAALAAEQADAEATTTQEAELLPAATLDELEQVDLGTVAEGERAQFRITDDRCADWAIRKIADERSEYDRLKALADEQIAAINEKVAAARKRMENGTSYLTSCLADFFATVPHKETKTTEKYRLLSGTLTNALTNGVITEGELAAPQANPSGPLAAQTQRGLTETGFAFLAEMERLHMIVDVSHLSDRGFWDIVEHSTRPFAASHSNCRALCPHTRNLTDAMIRALAEKGGIAGLNYYAAFLDTDPAHPEACRSTVERIAEHAAHYKQVGGIGVLALGSDFDGIDGHHQLETAADMPLLADALRRAGFTEDEVERIFWRNARDFFEHNL